MEDAEPQQSISFDQSGSTANYLRANGPDIALNIDDVLARNFGVGSSSSSSSDATSAEPEVQSAPSLSFQAQEMAAFQHLMITAVPPTLHFPLVINPSHLGFLANQQQHDIVDNSLAIVPAQPPCLHTVVLHAWAYAQDLSVVQPSTKEVLTADRGLAPSLDVPPPVTTLADSLRMSLPKAVSRKKANNPLVTTAIRRSSRLNNMDGYKHVQLEDTPRKKRKVVTAPVSHSLEPPPPKPSEGIPPPVPMETLQSWAIQCSVPPSEVTLDVLLSNVSNDEDNST
jgi:hypothetical protein